MNNYRFNLCKAGWILCLMAGCGSDSAVWVQGKVVLDGTPLSEANISFVPKSGGQDSAAWATIDKGDYSIPTSSGLRAGEYRVEIRALRTTGKSFPSDDPSIPVNSKDIVPPRYNSRTELIADIKIGENEINYDLKSK